MMIKYGALGGIFRTFVLCIFAFWIVTPTTHAMFRCCRSKRVAPVDPLKYVCEVSVYRDLENGRVEFCRLPRLVQGTERRGSSEVFRDAIWAEDVGVMGDLLRHGVTINDGDEESQVVPLELAVHWRRPLAVDFLLENGADVHRQGFDGITLLASVARPSACQGISIMHALLRHGADVDAGCITPLVAALTSKNLEAMNLLLMAGADSEALDWEGRTPMQFAAELAHTKWQLMLCVRGLLAHGARLSALPDTWFWAR